MAGRWNSRSAVLLVLAAVLLGVAASRLARYARAHRNADELAFFYDLSERKLFVAPRTLVPPIRGINDDTADGMRAVVISATGDPKDVAGRRIAYLEMYAPELKQQIEERRNGTGAAVAAGPGAGPGAGESGVGLRIGRTAAQAMIFVRRLNEDAWYPVNSAEAERIMTEWQVPGPDGRIPVVCVP